MISESILHDIQQKIKVRSSLGKRAPCLAVVVVGADPASAIYVRNKRSKLVKKWALPQSHMIYQPAPLRPIYLQLIDSVKQRPRC